MTRPAADLGREARSQNLWSYNIRILLGNSYWLIVTPVAAAQLVLFWNMATAGLGTPARAAQTIELLAPILGAYLCAHALAPEQAGVRELVFVRPVSLEKVLLVRLGVMFAFVFVVLVPALAIFQWRLKAFPMGLTLLAGVPSTLFLSVLAMALASAARNPLVGLGVAGAYWVLDFVGGTYFNPLVSLHSFSDYVAKRPLAMSDYWAYSKLLMLGLAVLLYLWNRRLLHQPAPPKRWVAAARVSVVSLLIIVAYMGSGAGYKLLYGMRHESQLGYRAHLWYKQQFGAYGPLPVVRLFGPAFPLYVQPGTTRGTTLAWAGTVFPDQKEIASMKRLLRRHPDSIWADNAAFEIARSVSRQPAAEVWALTVYHADTSQPTTELAELDLAEAAQEYRRFAERYPRSPFVPLALEQWAGVALSVLDFAGAQEAYERLVRGYPSARQSRQAGLALSALYLRQGRWQEAIKAADVAAGAAPWDLRAEALLAAAQAAERGGDGPGARDRYQRAHAAAKRARRGASEHWQKESELSGGQIVLRSDAVMAACEKALAGELKSFTPAPPSGVEVKGRVVRHGEGVPRVRVALGVEADSNGKPSPFLPTPAAEAETGADGTFVMHGVEPGAYKMAAFAHRQPGNSRLLDVARPALPIIIGQAPVVLPNEHLVPRVAPRPGPPGVGTGRAGPSQTRGQQRGQPGVRGGGRGGTIGGARGGRGGAGRMGGERGAGRGLRGTGGRRPAQRP